MFRRLQLHSLAFAVVVGFLALFPSSASAGPINAADVVWVLDNGNNVIVSLTHLTQGPFPHNSAPGAIVSPSGFWVLTLTGIQESGAATVRVVGSIQHLMPPAGHIPAGPGPLFEFNLLIQAPNTLRTTDTCCAMMHEIHRDLYTASLQGVGNLSLTSWTFRVEGVHTPEPATMLLLGTGLTAVGAIVRKRRRRRTPDKE